MRAIQVAAPGGPEVLDLVELPTPSPGPGQVLVSVEAAGVNYIDTYRREGIYPMPLPFIVGSEGAGRVTELGPGVTELEIGDLIAWKEAAGSYSTHAVVAVAEAIPVPDGVSAQTAAAVLLQGLTAHYLAFGSYAIQPGDVVVVHAAAGGVGLLLTQIAKLLGATVIGTVSTPEKAEIARAAGADHAVGYDEFVDLAKSISDGAGAHVVYDGVGATTFDDSLRALRVRGSMVLFGAASGPVPPIDLQRLNSGGGLFISRPALGWFTRDRDELLSRTTDLFGWIAKGELEVSIGGTYPLEAAADAHRDLEGRRTTGKLLLIP